MAFCTEVGPLHTAGNHPPSCIIRRLHLIPTTMKCKISAITEMKVLILVMAQLGSSVASCKFIHLNITWPVFQCQKTP